MIGGSFGRRCFESSAKRQLNSEEGAVTGTVHCSTYIMVQCLSLQAELRGGGVSELRGKAQVWELHAATNEEH